MTFGGPFTVDQSDELDKFSQFNEDFSEFLREKGKGDPRFLIPRDAPPEPKPPTVMEKIREQYNRILGRKPEDRIKFNVSGSGSGKGVGFGSGMSATFPLGEDELKLGAGVSGRLGSGSPKLRFQEFSAALNQGDEAPSWVPDVSAYWRRGGPPIGPPGGPQLTSEQLRDQAALERAQTRIGAQAQWKFNQGGRVRSDYG